MVPVTQNLDDRTHTAISDSMAWRAPWHPATRIAFRFCFTYFGLFCLWFAQVTFVFTGVAGRWLPDEAIMWQMVTFEGVTVWVGWHVLGVDAVLHRDSGSGDQAAIWVGVLLAPQIRRLANVLVLERPSEPASQPLLFATRRANRIAALVQLLLGIWVLIGCLQVGREAWHEFGDGRPKPELYGIWTVTDFSVDGKALPPLTTDETRWQRLVFDEPGVATYQRMDGELVPVAAKVDAGIITLPELDARFTYDRSASDRLRLDGRLGGRPVTMSLERVDPNTFTLRSRGFHWVQEYPYFT
jgi:hypothetical protein